MGKINYTLLNASVLNASRLNMTGETGKPGGGGGGYWPEGTPAAIRKSAVLWYDIALQGATNENLAEHPYLKDLTGNGHDMELRGFAWTEESGISTENYPGALVSDGVDDYGICEGVPIMDDFTIYVYRNYINGGTTSLATKYLNTFTVGAFQLERSQIAFYSFGNYNAIKIPSGNVIYATPTSYNGVAIERGNGVDSDRLSLFSLNGTSGGVSAALYRLILFNRALTDEEIDWVRVNIMAEPQPTPELDASLVDAWVFSGYRNEDAPASVSGEKGRALMLRNFAFTEGSGFADGWIVTDGVDDYAENLNMPALTDYTFITRRTLINFEGYASVASKAYGAGINGAFLFECRNSVSPGAAPNYTASFERTEEGASIGNVIPEAVSWQTKTSYNGKTLSPGNLADGKLFYLASARTTGNCVAAKFAWCALYDRSLTEEEINAEVAKLDALWEARKV